MRTRRVRPRLPPPGSRHAPAQRLLPSAVSGVAAAVSRRGQQLAALAQQPGPAHPAGGVTGSAAGGLPGDVRPAARAAVAVRRAPQLRLAAELHHPGGPAPAVPGPPARPDRAGRSARPGRLAAGAAGGDRGHRRPYRRRRTRMACASPPRAGWWSTCSSASSTRRPSPPWRTPAPRSRPSRPTCQERPRWRTRIC